MTSYMKVYKAMSHVMLPCMHELSPAPTLVAKINGGYFLNSPHHMFQLHAVSIR
jgi:hypothetical protein